ncbi:hypothetical protein SBDP1_320023 [Syntrophobacter sp. SbD1]|nr:hypothetical protein SBDP1_320023 [Syntrophobacter sp. SbD1]
MSHSMRYVPHALDYEPRAVSFGKDFHLRATVPVHLQTGQSRLLIRGAGVVFYNGDEGMVEISSQPPKMWRRLDLHLAGYGPGYGSDPVLVDHEGVVYRWPSGSEPISVFSTGIQGNCVSAWGLPEGRLLLLREEKGAWSTQIVEAETSRPLWSLPEAFPMLLPFEDCLIVRPRMTVSSVVCLDVESGQVRWRHESEHRLGDIIAVVDRHVWLNTQESGLISLLVDDGVVQDEIALKNNRNPQGVLDTQGYLHICNGLNYQIIDINDGTSKLISYVEFENLPEAPTTARGMSSVFLSDGRLLFHDDHGKVFVVHPENGEHPHCIWDKSRVFNLGIAEDQLVLLDWDGKITILGSAHETGSVGM